MLEDKILISGPCSDEVYIDFESCDEEGFTFTVKPLKLSAQAICPACGREMREIVNANVGYVSEDLDDYRSVFTARNIKYIWTCDWCNQHRGG